MLNVRCEMENVDFGFEIGFQPSYICHFTFYISLGATDLPNWYEQVAFIFHTIIRK